jgi:hypothetical protein
MLVSFSSDEDGRCGADGVQLPSMSGAEPLEHTVVWHLPSMSGAEPLEHTVVWHLPSMSGAEPLEHGL